MDLRGAGGSRGQSYTGWLDTTYNNHTYITLQQQMYPTLVGSIPPSTITLLLHYSNTCIHFMMSVFSYSNVPLNVILLVTWHQDPNITRI
jgi:hypothetical protein